MITDRQVIENYISLLEDLSRDTGVSRFLAGGFVGYSLSGSAWPDLVFCSETLDRAKTKEQLEKIRDAGGPRTLAINDVDLTDHSDAFSDLGYFPVAQWTNMFYDHRLPVIANNSLQVVTIPAEDEDLVRSWTSVVSANLFGDKLLDHRIFLAGVARNQIELLAVFGQHGSIEATTLLYRSTGNLAGIYMVSTLPECRGRGHARNLVTYALNKAKESGFVHTVLSATDVAVKLYGSLGFQGLGKLNIYYNIK